MMIQFGLDKLLNNFPQQLQGRSIGVLCHAASVTSKYVHIIDALRQASRCTIHAVFGPQHGLFGQTQDNMIEWEGGGTDSSTGTMIYSLYGKNRKPSPAMLEGLDAFMVDLQDIGARPYTYIWTMKNCMEACMEKGIPIIVLDRPNPVGCIGFDGPMLQSDHFSFVGGAEIPLCHRMTTGEIAVLLQKTFFKSLELQVVWMDGWWRDSLYSETGLPWVLPSPNMPTQDTAIVYPGMVLLEATNMSEGRGTTRPFELFGAPYLDGSYVKKLNDRHLPGCFFREHCFIPTFQKWQGTYCQGVQIHVNDPRSFRPVLTAAAIIAVAMENGGNAFAFKAPPYEYETVKLPFDILAGSGRFRMQLTGKMSPADIDREWDMERAPFVEIFNDVAHYQESRQ